MLDWLWQAAPPQHFEETDEPLITEYAVTVCQLERARLALREQGEVVGNKQNAWLAVQGQARKALATLTMRLRLSPQARRDRALVNRPLTWSEQFCLDREAEEVGKRRPWDDDA